jgi:hypothetical protein
MIAIPGSSLLVQQHGDAELPGTGQWPLHRASFVGMSSRRDQVQLSVQDGSLNLTEPPDRSTLAITAARGDRGFRLRASTVGFRADGHGFSRWRLDGVVADGTTRHAIRLDMTYHGVRRSGDRAWAWFTGHAVTAPATGRFWHRQAALVVVLDLLFDAPTTHPAASPRRTVQAGRLGDTNLGSVARCESVRG